MDGDSIFAPWRMEWVSRERDREDDCVFCSIGEDTQSRKNRVVANRSTLYVVLNKSPYNPGHCMVVPYDHGGDLTDLDDGTLSEMIEAQRDTVAVLTEVFQPEGFNIGMNIGEAAGASVPDHLHVHVIPRWGSDTTFMPTTANTNVIVEALDDTYDRLDVAFSERFERSAGSR